jgi:SagB-type dehydrogenase family enzyme
MSWDETGPVIENYWRQTKTRIDERDRVLLDRLDTWQTIGEVSRDAAGWEPDALRLRLSALASAGILIEEGSSDVQIEAAIETWHAGQAARHFFFGTRDLAERPIDSDPDVAREIMRQEPQPDRFKLYPDARRISLPTDWPPITEPLEEVLLKRESVREFADAAISVATLSHLLFLTFGQTGWKAYGVFGDLPTKVPASAGGRHPTEAYLVLRNVTGLTPGLYHYAVQGHALELLREGDFTDEIDTGVRRDQPWFATAPVVIVMTLVLARTMWKYRFDRAIRDCLMDLGHVGQTLYLVATALGLGTVVTSAAQETPFEALLGIDGVTESAAYVAAVGRLPADHQPQHHPLSA